MAKPSHDLSVAMGSIFTHVTFFLHYLTEADSVWTGFGLIPVQVCLSPSKREICSDNLSRVQVSEPNCSDSTQTNSDSTQTPCYSAQTGAEYVGHSKDPEDWFT